MSRWATTCPPEIPDGAAVIYAGDLDPVDVDRLGQELQHLADPARGAVIDLQHVTAIDLAAIDPLVDSAERLRREGVDVQVTPAWAEHVFRLTGRWAC